MRNNYHHYTVCGRSFPRYSILRTGQTIEDYYHLYTIDFDTKELSFLAKLEGDGKSVVVGAPSTFDNTQGIFYSQFMKNITSGVNIYAVETQGAKRGTVTIIDQNGEVEGQSLGTMDADDSGIIYGLGMQNDTRAIIALDPTTGGYEAAQLIPDYLISSGGTTALDRKTHVLYSVLQPSNDVKYYTDATDCGSAGCAAGASCCREPTPGSKGCCFKVDKCSQLPVSSGFNATDPFRIVGVNLESGDIVSDAPLCTQEDQNCPWGLVVISA